MFINQVTFAGTTDREAQTRQFNDNQKVTNFSLCFKKSYKGKESSLWMNVSAFGDAGKEAAKIKPGDNVVVMGALSVYQDKSGEYKTTITAQTVGIVVQDIPEPTFAAQSQPVYQVILDDDIPF